MANGSAAKSVVDIAIEEIGKIADVQDVIPITQADGGSQQPIGLEIVLFYASKSFVVDETGLPHGYLEKLNGVLARLQKEHRVRISTVTDYAPPQPMINQWQRYIF